MRKQIDGLAAIVQLKDRKGQALLTPEKLYADIRRLSMFRDQLNEDRIRNLNRLHREMKIYFPEYKDAFGKIDGAFSLELLKAAPFPDELAALGTEQNLTKTFILAFIVHCFRNRQKDGQQGILV